MGLKYSHVFFVFFHVTITWIYGSPIFHGFEGNKLLTSIRRLFIVTDRQAASHTLYTLLAPQEEILDLIFCKFCNNNEVWCDNNYNTNYVTSTFFTSLTLVSVHTFQHHLHHNHHHYHYNNHCLHYYHYQCNLYNSRCLI